jgi:hypothetical protein
MSNRRRRNGFSRDSLTILFVVLRWGYCRMPSLGSSVLGFSSENSVRKKRKKKKRTNDHCAWNACQVNSKLPIVKNCNRHHVDADLPDVMNLS